MGSGNKGYKEVNKTPRTNGRFAPKGNSAMINLTLRLPAELIELIETEANKKGISKTDVAREILIKAF